MTPLSALAVLGLASLGQALTLGPVPCSSTASNGTASTVGKNSTTGGSNPTVAGVPPLRNITLNYGVDGNSLVNVSLAMREPAVLLETIPGIETVDCSSDSVAVTFNSSAAFRAAALHWKRPSSIVLVTNHLGDCDAELERGFFHASDFEADNSSLTIVATTSKTGIQQEADFAEISFSSLPSYPVGNARRAIEWNPTLLNISNTLALPADTTLYKYDPYLSVVADRASVESEVTLSGYLKFSILELKLKELYVDFDTSLAADLGITVDVVAPYNTTAEYKAPELAYSLVDIPGILQLGPSLGFAVGVDVKANAAVSITAEVGLDMPSANAHVDFRDSSLSSATGWTPTYYARANVSEKAVVSVDPYVDVSVELECNILGGLLDLGIGLEAVPRFNNDFALSATQAVDAGTGFSQPTDGDCSQGLEITSEFVFNLMAKVTQFWSDTIYSVTVPIVTDECYSWL